MATEVSIPGLGAGMAEGTIVEWGYEDGATVTAGSILYTLESEKSTQDVDAPVSGTLRRIGLVGETYAVGTVVAVID